MNSSDRDYVAKKLQYQDCGIPEYWIIDPDAQTVLILKLSENNYQEVGSFSAESQLPSPQFPTLDLTPTHIFAN